MPNRSFLNGFGKRRDKKPKAAEPVRSEAPARRALPEHDEVSSFLGRMTTGSKGTIGELDEAFEDSQVGKNEPGKLIPISEGRPGAGSRVSVHGMGGAPEAVDPLTQMAKDGGSRTSTFAYDDMSRRLGKSSDDLMASLQAEMKANPDGPLVVDAHSMGTRVTLDAMRKMTESGALGDREVELNLVAPLLAGITGGGSEIGTNLSRLSPGLGGMIDGIRPGKDMGTGSPFQKKLDRMQLPENVKTRLFTGTEDDMVDTEDPRWQRLAGQLNAEHISFDGADHDTVVDAAAQYMSKEKP